MAMNLEIEWRLHDPLDGRFYGGPTRSLNALGSLSEIYAYCCETDIPASFLPIKAQARRVLARECPELLAEYELARRTKTRRVS